MPYLIRTLMRQCGYVPMIRFQNHNNIMSRTFCKSLRSQIFGSLEWYIHHNFHQIPRFYHAINAKTSDFKPFNLILEYGQSNVPFDQVSFGISLLLAPDATFRFLFTNWNLYEFSKYGYVGDFSFLYATGNTTIFFTLLVLRKVNCESVSQNAIFFA